MSTVTDFKECHKRFADALKYVVENEKKLKTDPVKWEKILKNFQTKFEKPLDAAWGKLTKEEKKRFSTLYLHRKVSQDETVKKVMDKFDARIVSVSEE